MSIKVAHVIEFCSYCKERFTKRANDTSTKCTECMDSISEAQLDRTLNLTKADWDLLEDRGF